MRLSLRFVIPLLGRVAVLLRALPLVDKLMLRWFSRDLEVRANLIATTVDDPLHNLIQTGDRSRIQEFFTRLTQESACPRRVLPRAKRRSGLATRPAAEVAARTSTATRAVERSASDHERSRFISVRSLVSGGSSCWCTT